MLSKLVLQNRVGGDGDRILEGDSTRSVRDDDSLCGRHERYWDKSTTTAELDSKQGKRIARHI